MIDTPLRMLVADDDALVSAMIQNHLEMLGHTVVGEAANGQQAVALAQELQPDMILMDLKMPQMDGIEAARRIQACCPTPVVILTAFESPDLVREASEAGVGAYLVKPSGVRELERAITIARARFDDLMELRRLNAALQKSQRRLEEQNVELRKLTQAVEQSANTVVITDLEGCIEYVNPKFVETTGYTAEEALGQNPRILKSGRQGDDFYRELWTTIRAGREWRGEFHNKRKDGSLYWELATIAPVYDAKGRMTHFIAVKEDITARKKAAEALQRERNLLRTLIDTLPDIILVKDTAGRFVVVNKALAQIAGASSPEEMVGRTEFDFVPHDLAAKFWEVEQEVMRSGRPLVNHMEHSVNPAGETRWILTTKMPFYDTQGRTAGVVGIARDVTALKEAEEQLRRYAEQLEAQNAELAAFAHTVAHDLKNPVNVFVGYASMLAQEYDSLPDETRRKFLHTLVQHSHKMNTIIDELLLLVSVREMDQVDLQPLDMELILDEALSRLHDMIREYQAELILPEHWPQAVGHGPWVEAMWVNYLSNALKYGGRPPRVELGATVLTDNQVKFWVRDNGPGLSPEEQARLFTPFERLHQARAEGHGLGLSIVQRIADKLDGEVGVESTVGQGSTFYFTLSAPVSPKRLTE